MKKWDEMAIFRGEVKPDCGTDGCKLCQNHCHCGLNPPTIPKIVMAYGHSYDRGGASLAITYSCMGRVQYCGLDNIIYRVMQHDFHAFVTRLDLEGCE